MSLSVWVGLSIFADMANERLALSSQAVLMAGPPSQGSLSGGLRATYIEATKCTVCLYRARFGVSRLLPADFLGEGAAFSHGSGR